jgi:thioredoxin-related protein
MQFLYPVLLTVIFSSVTTWQTDFEKAKAQAQSENKLILLNFSGSDWCGPCIRLKKDIFEHASFISYADENLVLVNADFPRLKKNMLSKELQKQNEALADTYNSSGAFPLTLLLDAEGKVLKKWEGLPAMSPEEFTNDIKAATDAAK